MNLSGGDAYLYSTTSCVLTGMSGLTHASGVGSGWGHSEVQRLTLSGGRCTGRRRRRNQRMGHGFSPRLPEPDGHIQISRVDAMT